MSEQVDIEREVLFSNYEFSSKLLPKLSLCHVNGGQRRAVLEIGGRPIYEFHADNPEYLETLGLLFAHAAREVRGESD